MTFVPKLLLSVSLCFVTASAFASPIAAPSMQHGSRRAWDPAVLSNPAHHDNAHFRYLVHMVNPINLEARGVTDLAKVSDFLNRGTGRNVSLSLIDQDHHATFGDVGFIVRVPRKNIVEDGPGDLMRQGRSRVESKPAKKVFLSPDELLAQTPTNRYNEVVARPRTSGGKLEVVGLVKVDYGPAMTAGSRNLDTSFQNFSNASGLPVVHLAPPPP